ncbi:hypothetical protein [Bifidobacterium magnum]|uniref:hypothetical protein n=1 Tax=Bifidobacterium magnum TaxID=1692 RepID=UPI0003B73F8E|nr:hypothetical protein [Bifidobacterium magnum]
MKKIWYFVIAAVLIVVALVLKFQGVSPWICAPCILVAAIVGVLGIYKRDKDEQEPPNA